MTTIATFKHDMNSHPGADYYNLDGPYVAEVETHGATLKRKPTWTITIWKAMPDLEPMNEDNRYEWAGSARASYADREAVTADVALIKTKTGREQFTEKHPYSGPRDGAFVRKMCDNS